MNKHLVLFCSWNEVLPFGRLNIFSPKLSVKTQMPRVRGERTRSNNLQISSSSSQEQLLFWLQWNHPWDNFSPISLPIENNRGLQKAARFAFLFFNGSVHSSLIMETANKGPSCKLIVLDIIILYSLRNYTCLQSRCKSLCFTWSFSNKAEGDRHNKSYIKIRIKINKIPHHSVS